jgi:hypothetical protein
MAIDTGPTVATADCRSVSLPLVTSVKPVHVATALLLSKLQSSSYNTDDKMFTECFVDRCLSFCTFYFWLLCCLFFFDLRILITSLWYLQTVPILFCKQFENKTFIFFSEFEFDCEI